MRSYDASGIEALPVPVEWIAQVVQTLRERVDDLVIIGAAARDLLASHAGDLSIQRVTKDLDVAVAVSDMGTYRLATGRFDPHRAEPQFLYRGHPIDVIPFGGVEQNDRHVLFESDHKLDVTGLAEAAASKVDVTLRPGVVVPVASLEAQSALKVLAWRDRRYDTRDKDAMDLAYLLKAASRGIYADAVLVDIEAMEATDHGLDEAGAFRLGRRAALIFEPPPREVLASHLGDEEFCAQLARAMGGSSYRPLLAAYAEGFLTASG